MIKVDAEKTHMEGTFPDITCDVLNILENYNKLVAQEKEDMGEEFVNKFLKDVFEEFAIEITEFTKNFVKATHQ